MRVTYTRRSKFKLFGIKVFEHIVDYNERSTDKDDNENEMYIELIERKNEG